jgi:hypothetical protein
MIRTAEANPAASVGSAAATADGSKTPSGIPAEAIHETSAGYLLVDAWGHPFQYSFGEADTVNPIRGRPPYDLWSFGKARSQLRTDRAAKRDIKIVDDWLINWE